jgi:KaiC/GvpD/RAD55 family RecA-like ATPase
MSTPKISDHNILSMLVRLELKQKRLTMRKNKMTEEEISEHMKTISFSNLVKEINEKWSHTYIDVSNDVDEEATIIDEQ